MAGELVRYKSGPLSYLEAGGGTPFLLLHGLSSSASSWEQVGIRLSNHFRVIAPDLLGFGESDSPSDDFYMEDQAHAIKGLLDRLGVRSLYLAGHDFGGPVAVTLMRLFPSLQMLGLVLSNTNMFTDTFVPLPLRAAGIPGLGWLVYKLMAGSTFGLRMTHLAGVANKRTLPWREFRRGVDSRNLDMTQRIFQRSLADLKGNYQGVQDHLGSIRCRSLVIWGGRDPFFRVDVGSRTAAALVNCSYKQHDSAGHFAPQEVPDAYANDILEAFGHPRPARTAQPVTRTSAALDRGPVGW